MTLSDRFCSGILGLSLGIGLACLAAAPGFAQTPPAPPAPQIRPQPALPGPPKQLPALKGRTPSLDFLFEALKAAPDEDSAKYTEGRIWSVWLNTASDTTNLLMSRVARSVETQDVDIALKLLDALIEIRPTYAEAWNRRATLKFAQKDFGGALSDLSMVLSLEPRHFGALAGLGVILEQIGEDRRALEAYRRALAIYPRMEHIAEQVKTLSVKVEGRDI